MQTEPMPCLANKRKAMPYGQNEHAVSLCKESPVPCSCPGGQNVRRPLDTPLLESEGWQLAHGGYLPPVTVHVELEPRSCRKLKQMRTPCLL